MYKRHQERDRKRKRENKLEKVRKRKRERKRKRVYVGLRMDINHVCVCVTIIATEGTVIIYWPAGFCFDCIENFISDEVSKYVSAFNRDCGCFSLSPVTVPNTDNPSCFTVTCEKKVVNVQNRLDTNLF